MAYTKGQTAGRPIADGTIAEMVALADQQFAPAILKWNDQEPGVKVGRKPDLTIAYVVVASRAELIGG